MIGYLIMLITLLGTTDANTSAYDTLNQREGVCKDFAHLGIALCRALNMHAISPVMPQILIQDIHVVLRLYEGQWILFDPRLSNLSSLVKIAHGKTGQMLRLQIFSEMLLVPMNIECEN
jgi:hypothetical protein